MNINEVWPEWREDCVLGEGSFGKVYRAKRVEHGHTFYSAIKVISVPKTQQEIRNVRAQGMNDAEIYNYFQSLVENLINEITLMENLKGAKNIVGIDDYRIIEHEGEIGWDIFIRMELLTAFDSFVSNPNFTQKDVVRLGIDICTALETCEQNHIIHRDIKPDNIFISRFGEYKLGDFGIARKLEATQANLSRKGTLNYMAPEVYKGGEYGSGVDIYSLGLVLYTLLNNNRVAFLPPYPQQITYSDNEAALAKRLSGEPLTPPCNAGASLGAAILKACAYDPAERYQSATAFKNALMAEWNVLVQSGADKGINYGPVQYGAQEDMRFKNTTNDMTANGRIVVDEYAQGTTVMPDSDDPNAVWGGTYGANGQVYGQGEAGYGYAAPIKEAPEKKSTKICRVICYPLAVISLILGLGLLFRDGDFALKSRGVTMIAIGLIALLAGRNRLAMGLGVIAASFPNIVSGIGEFIARGPNAAFPVDALILVVSGLLVLVGGISIAAQKEPRTGGSMLIYALAIEWAYYIYNGISNGFSVPMLQIFFAIMALAVIFWSCGYNNSRELTGAGRILNYAGYAFAAAAVICAVIATIQGLKMIF